MSIKYSETISELYNLQKFSVKMGLENIRSLCEQLGNPQNSYRIIHIAGTNGKGSTAVIIQHVLSLQGLKVGLYTSPHLLDFRERIRINDQVIDKTFIVDYWQKISPLVLKLKATFFDTTTALAFFYFARFNVDVAVVETGLGGRLDSTNIVTPGAVVITPIAIDHVKQLGRNLKSVASEKASIIKRDATVFISRQKNPVLEILKNFIDDNNQYIELLKEINFKKIDLSLSESKFDILDKIRNCRIDDIRLNLAGHFQIENAGLAYLASRWMIENLKLRFSVNAFRRAMHTVQWPGRLQTVSNQPDIYFDVSHNYAGIKETVKFINKFTRFDSRLLLFGLLNDKEYKLIVRLISKYFSRIFVTEPKHEKALSGKILKKEFLRYGIKSKAVSNADEAYQLVRTKLKKTDTLLVMGSHFIIGQLLKR